jgi:hypothetical protein
MKTCPACGAALKRPEREASGGSYADRESSFQLLRLYTVFCEAVHMLVPGRITAIRVIIEGHDSADAPTEWTFGRRNLPSSKP